MVNLRKDFGREQILEMLIKVKDLDGMFGGLERRPYRVLGAGVFPLINLTEDKDNYDERAESNFSIHSGKEFNDQNQRT